VPLFGFLRSTNNGTTQDVDRRKMSGGKDLDLPWGGYKESGIGKEHGLYGLYEYTNLKRAQVDIKMLKK
jgi:acyl-CoA reductase-like NAD-dependent aldehyde dehydrogenase